jgi:hypothetical protein
VQGLRTKERAFQKMYLHCSKLTAAAATADRKKWQIFYQIFKNNVLTSKTKKKGLVFFLGMVINMLKFNKQTEKIGTIFFKYS